MERNTNVWLDRKVDDWVSKGWISEEARQKIRKSYGRDEQRKSLLTTLPLYALLAVIGGQSLTAEQIAPTLASYLDSYNRSHSTPPLRKWPGKL